MGTLSFKQFYQKNLPHIQPPGATLFVTFRLAGSIPSDALQQLLLRAQENKTILAQITDVQIRNRRTYEEQRRMFGHWDNLLDSALSGPHWLRQHRIAQLVADSMHFRDGSVYELDTYCIMSNHVHVIFTPLEFDDGTYHALPAIMHSLKRHTASQANQVLGRIGQFWQHESYDHIIRNQEEWARVRLYILNNPVKAGLVEQWGGLALVVL